jgi:hypothetical protein
MRLNRSVEITAWQRACLRPAHSKASHCKHWKILVGQGGKENLSVRFRARLFEIERRMEGIGLSILDWNFCLVNDAHAAGRELQDDATR